MENYVQFASSDSVAHPPPVVYGGFQLREWILQMP